MFALMCYIFGLNYFSQIFIAHLDLLIDLDCMLKFLTSKVFFYDISLFLIESFSS